MHCPYCGIWIEDDDVFHEACFHKWQHLVPSYDEAHERRAEYRRRVVAYVNGVDIIWRGTRMIYDNDLCVCKSANLEYGTWNMPDNRNYTWLWHRELRVDAQVIVYLPPQVMSLQGMLALRVPFGRCDPVVLLVAQYVNWEA